MSNLVTLQSDSALTPARVSSVNLDVPESVLIEPGLNVLRRGVEVAKRSFQGTANASEHVNMRPWSSGCWTTAPIQTEIANIQETTAAQPYILTASSWNFVVVAGPSGNQAMFQDVAHFSQSSVTGASYTANVPASGDNFLRKRVPATGSFNPGAVGANSGFDSALPAITYEYTDVPMDRVAVSSATCAANQGFFLRWRSPGALTTYPRYTWTFIFGQYALVIGGSGLAELWEYCAPAIGSTRWVRRDKWRFSQEGMAPGTAHAMGIFPHMRPTGERFIAFSSLSTALAPTVNTSNRADASDTSIAEHVYRVDQTVRGTDIDPSPGNVTKSGKVRIDVRRDLKIDLQVSFLAFQASGTLLDDDAVNGSGPNTANTATVNITPEAWYPAGTSITASVINPDTGAAFTPGTDLFPAAKFVLTGSGSNSPVLWGYTMQQAAVSSTITPGAFSMTPSTEGGGVKIDGYAGDPATEGATVVVDDITMAHTRLTKRGRFASTIATTFTPTGGTSHTVRLFQGICRKPRSVRHGTPRGLGEAADDWRRYTLSMSGMWDRLAERVQPGVMRSYAIDPAAAGGGTITPWKVTDALVDMLSSCGFVSVEINIPNLGYRLWPGYGSKGDDLQINPMASIAEAASRMVREYLGAYLCWEPNAGANGQWILLFGTQPGMGGTFTPVYNFVSTPPAYPKLPYHPASYPANTGIILEGVDYSQDPPDFNFVLVTTGIATTTAQTRLQVQAYASNPISYAVPGMSTSPNPDHPDYIGHCVPFVLIAPQLEVPGDYSGTQFAVNWTCRRYYDFLCHGRRIMHFRSPLAIIYDASISGGSSGGYRPLRFQDPVSIDGDNSWLIKAVRPSWTSDRMMMCEYECIQPFAGQYFVGHDGVEEHRRSVVRMSQRTTGLGSHSALHGVFAPSAHREGPHLELPVVRHGFGSIQNADGSFMSMTAWNTFNGTDG